MNAVARGDQDLGGRYRPTTEPGIVNTLQDADQLTDVAPEIRLLQQRGRVLGRWQERLLPRHWQAVFNVPRKAPEPCAKGNHPHPVFGPDQTNAIFFAPSPPPPAPSAPWGGC